MGGCLLLLSRAAAPFLEELAVVPGTLAFLTLIRDSQQYVVARSESPGGISVSIRVGYHYPLTSDAVCEYVARHSADQVTEALDQVRAAATSSDSNFATGAARQTLKRSDW